MARTANEFKGNQRFEIVRRLGAGGMGVVYEVHDRQRDMLVALKTLPVADPDALYRFKGEFRVLAGITHPNLASLYELFASDDQWFFTMEIVPGRTFIEFLQTHRTVTDLPTITMLSESAEAGDASESTGLGETTVMPAAGFAPAPRCDITTLREAFSQLVLGIHAIHQAGKLHRDLKPSNVLVTPSDRVVILDFGLAIDMEEESDPRMTDVVAGTPHYMSPEQCAGGALTEASDWYAAGVMLYEALTGALPFDSKSRKRLLRLKLASSGGRPSLCCGGIPEDLDRLCEDLLQLDPLRRPGGEEILRRLGGDAGSAAAAPAALQPSSVFVGREGPLAVLREAFQLTTSLAPAVVFLQGKSGMGKSVLVQHYLEECRLRNDTVVLAGRCFEQESVPYKALDALIDSLGRYLRRLPAQEMAELLPRHAAALAQMFPTFLRVPAIASAPRGRLATMDAIESRQLASAALREMLARITDRRRLVIAIDDLQWGDVDSALLLTELLAAPSPPPFLLLAASRIEEGQLSACLSHLRRDSSAAQRFEITLEPLTPADVIEMNARLNPGVALSGEDAARIARESSGNPLFIQEVLSERAPSDHGVANVDDLLWNRIQRLDESSRQLLEVVSISGRPIDLRLAFEAAELQEDGFQIYTALRNARLLRRAGTAEPELVETYHDRIRENITSRLGVDEARHCHFQLAAALQPAASSDPEHIAFHLERSGATERASEYYAQAAQRASAALAFDQAATLYARTLRLSTATGEVLRVLRTRHAEALAAAGRSHEAAQRFAEAAQDASGPELLDLKKRAAYYYMISGRIDEGKDAFRDVLAEFDLHISPTAPRAIAALLVARARLFVRGTKFTERHADEIPAAVRDHIDTVWSAAVGLGNTDVVSGLSFATRNVILSLDAGDPARAVRALLWEGSLASIEDLSRAAKLIDRAEEILPRCDGPYLRGMLYLAKGIYEMNRTYFRDATALFDKAQESWSEERTAADWELATARHFCFWCLSWSGEYLESERRIRIYRREAEERGNLYMLVNTGCLSEPLVHLAAGRPEDARHVLTDSMARWTKNYFLVQHAISGLCEIEMLLYAGDGPAAHQAYLRQVQISNDHGLDRMSLNRTHMGVLGLNALILAASANQEPDRSIAGAETLIKRLNRETIPWAKAAVEGGRACVAVLRRDQSSALRHLETADDLYSAIGMKFHAATARRLQGRMLGNDRGRQLVAEAEAWMREHGVNAVDSFSNRVIPVLT